MDLTEARDILRDDHPIYMFLKTEERTFVDKILYPHAERFGRTRYWLDDNRCTCLSFIKVGRCKHLDLLNNEYDWIGEGALRVDAGREFARLTDALSETFESAPTVEETDRMIAAMPDNVKMIAFTLRANKVNASVIKIVKVMQFFGTARLAVELVFQHETP